MGVVYNCKYCGKESNQESFQYEGKVVDFQDFINKLTDEISEQCGCQQKCSFTIKCNTCSKEIIVNNSTNLWEKPQVISVGFDQIWEKKEFECVCGNSISF